MKKILIYVREEELKTVEEYLDKAPVELEYFVEAAGD